MIKVVVRNNNNKEKDKTIFLLATIKTLKPV